MQSPSSSQSWRRGLSWNVGALGVAGLAALSANAVIARSFGPVGLGVFSQAMTWFALMAQVAALGIHYAVLREAANSPGPEAARRSVEVGVGAVLAIASIAGVVSFLLAPAVGAAVDSVPLVGAIRFASAALVVHAVAKVAGAGLNGLHRMRAFSAVNAARGVGLLGASVLLGAVDAPIEAIGSVFLASEALAATVAVGAWRGVRPRFRWSEARELTTFGARATGAAVTVEANSRVDVAVLGLLASDRVVGIYALAATAFEGFLQLFVVLRNQVNPAVSAAIGRGAPHEVDGLQRQLRPWVVGGAALALAVAMLMFPLGVRSLGLSQDFVAATLPLGVLLAGLVAAAPWLPFDQLLVVGGFPGAQSRAVAWSLVVNVALNLLLVPLLGGTGAAAATAIALFVLVAGVTTRGRRYVGTSFGPPPRVLWMARGLQ